MLHRAAGRMKIWMILLSQFFFISYAQHFGSSPTFLIPPLPSYPTDPAIPFFRLIGLAGTWYQVAELSSLATTSPIQCVQYNFTLTNHSIQMFGQGRIKNVSNESSVIQEKEQKIQVETKKNQNDFYQTLRTYADIESHSELDSLLLVKPKHALLPSYLLSVILASNFMPNTTLHEWIVLHAQQIPFPVIWVLARNASSLSFSLSARIEFFLSQFGIPVEHFAVTNFSECTK